MAEQIKNTLLWEVIPAYSKAIASCLDTQSFKAPSLSFIEDIVKLIFPDEKFILDKISQPQEIKVEEVKDNSQISFCQSVQQDAARYEEASVKVLAVVDQNIQSVRAGQMLQQQMEQVLASEVRQKIADQSHTFLNVLKQQLTDLDQQKVRFEQMKTEIAVKFKLLVDQGIEQLRPLQAQQKAKEIVVAKQLKHRFSDDYLPSQKEQQDYQSYNQVPLSFDRHIVGIGDYGMNYEFYFIFNDKTRTQNDLTNQKNFKDVMINPEGAVIKRVRLQYYTYQDSNEGSLTGLEFYDNQNQLILRAGQIESHKNSSYYKTTEFSLEEGERLIGIKSGLVSGLKTRHRKFQFIIGRVE